MTRRREIIGVVLVALTASTVFTLFIAVERADRPIEILENSYPPVLRHDLRNTFSLGVIARKPMAFLDIEVAVLSHHILSENITQGGREGMLSVPAIATLDTLLRGVGLEPLEYEVQDFRRGLGNYDLYIFDFTPAYSPLVEDAILSGYSGMGVTTVYAGLFNESGLMFFYGGSPDFFSRRNITITELSISLNDDKDVYKRIKELSPAETQAGVATLLDAPPGGRLRLVDVDKDDTLRLAFSVDRSTVGGINTILGIDDGDKLEFLKILVDGDVEQLMVNWVVAG